MKKYSEMKAAVRVILDAAGFTEVPIYAGPELQDVPDEYVLLTRYGGPGIDADGAIDVVSWQVRSVGQQMEDDSSAEDIADAIDIAFLSHYSRLVGSTWVSSIQRVGGAPSSLAKDDADRTHFVCSYLVSVELALSN
jgi:hypothetical protein